MTTGVVAGVRDFFQRYFPERQLYHRCHGSVQFMTLSAPVQVGLLVVSLGFLCWVAFASVNVVFKDQIITAKEQHFVRMQTAYEGRLAEMQSAYDELNAALVLTQERFADATSELEAKHLQLSQIIAHQQTIQKGIEDMRHKLAAMGTTDKQYAAVDTNSGKSSNKLLMSVTELEVAPRQSKVQGSFLGGALATVTAAVQSARGSSEDEPEVATALGAETQRIDLRLSSLTAAQKEFVNSLEENTVRTVTELESIMAVTGLDVGQLMDRTASAGLTTGTGGPVINIADMDRLTDAEYEDNDFGKQVYRLVRHLDRLSTLHSALSSMPLITPIDPNSRISSNFGRRYDPYTKRPAFHSGVDMVAPYRTPVLSTAPGKVSFAGRRGPYGRLVEVDHGNGFKTRYGHLHRISVKKGEYVDLQQQIGLLGSSGRSTGPHVHYEVWYNGKLRNPGKFFEAGRYVFKK